MKRKIKPMILAIGQPGWKFSAEKLSGLIGGLASGRSEENDTYDANDINSGANTSGGDRPGIYEEDEDGGKETAGNEAKAGGKAAAGQEDAVHGASAGNTEENLINENGDTVKDRILAPEGFERVEAEEGSFGEYLRNFPVKPHGSGVLYYDGRTKPLNVHAAVLDMDVGNRDLQQCADSIIRLRAEYLYGKGFYDKIHFKFTNGFNADFSKWIKGYRIKISGNSVSWVRQGEASSDYASFRKYLDMVFAYAGTLSLSKEMESIPAEEMKPGDVFIYGSAPGHCTIVMDMAENKISGEKVFILAQGYMPAQEMHILKNPANGDENPWYSLDFGDNLGTPEWEFTRDQLMRFRD